MPTDDATSELADRALAVLRRLVGREDVVFHDGQLEAVVALVRDRSRALVVQRTGWGKSAVYFVATALRRADGAGPTIIVSPLLALMRDQIAAAARAGVRAVTMNSANVDEWDQVSAALAADEVDVLLVSPERLNNPRFREQSLPGLAARTGLLVIDEAHCVSDWGHDFRPDYRRIGDLLAALPAGTPVLATTATANSRVVHDVAEQLGADGTDVLTVRGGLARDTLRLGVLRTAAPEQRVGWLVAHLGDLPGSGIIYTLTVSAAEDLAVSLREAGYQVAAYTGRTDPADRVGLEAALRANEVKALVATSALGMGFDKPDLGFVVHVGAPSSPIAYYQQVGRAGRSLAPGATADVLLMPGPEDQDIWQYFATASMPRQDLADAVLAALAEAAERGASLSVAALESMVDLRRGRLDLLLKVLDVDGAVERVGGGWRSTGQGWTYDAARYARVNTARLAEQRAMLDYEAEPGCRMTFLQQALDDPSVAPGDRCGRCDRCAGVWFDPQVPDAALGLARAQLAKVGIEIERRAQWPTGMDRLGVPVRGRIGPDEAADGGRAIARLSDLGWGTRVRQAVGPAAVDGPVGPDLMRGCVEVLKDWPWAQRPVAVVAMPSRRLPMLIESVAESLAGAGRLAWLGVLEVRHGGPAGLSGETGGNSAFRLASVWDRIGVPEAMRERLALRSGADAVRGPILLVDDLVDSRWTMTVAARELRSAGADAVLPFALGRVG